MSNEKKIMSRDEILATLKGMNVAKVEVLYSGGHDEGGVDQIDLFDADGKKIRSMEEYYGGTMVWDEATKGWKPAEAPTDEQRLSQALCVPVYDKYCSFAGDFYVNGTITWDVENRRVRNHGTEEISQDDSFDDYI